MFHKIPEPRQSDRPRHRTIQDIEREISKLQEDMGFYRHQTQAVELKASLEARLVALREELAKRKTRDAADRPPRAAGSAMTDGGGPSARAKRTSDADAAFTATSEGEGDSAKAAAAKRRKLRMVWASDLRRP